MNLKNFFKQYGSSAFPRLIKVVLRKVGVIFETFYLLKYNINEVDINTQFNKFDYSNVIEITEKDISSISFLDDAKIELYRERFKNGAYSCFAIEENEEIEYLTWISWKHMNYPTFFEKSEDLEANQALLEDSFCSPQHRGKGYHSKMNIFRLKKISDREKTEVLVLVLKENKPALKVQLKSGFNYYSSIRFVKIGRWNKTFQKIIK